MKGDWAVARLADASDPAAEEAADSYEREYYLGFPQAMTISEYAEALEELERGLE